MEKDKEKWIEEIMGSFEKVERATPDPELFTSIEQRISGLSDTKVSIFQWRMIAAAALLLMLLNAFAVSSFFRSQNQGQENQMTINSIENDLISNYKLYEL